MTSPSCSKQSGREGGTQRQTGCFTTSQLRSKSRDFLSILLVFFFFFSSLFRRSALLRRLLLQDHACCSETRARETETRPETSQRPVKHEELLFHLGDQKNYEKITATDFTLGNFLEFWNSRFSK